MFMDFVHGAIEAMLVGDNVGFVEFAGTAHILVAQKLLDCNLN